MKFLYLVISGRETKILKFLRVSQEKHTVIAISSLLKGIIRRLRIEPSICSNDPKIRRGETSSHDPDFDPRLRDHHQMA